MYVDVKEGADQNYLASTPPKASIIASQDFPIAQGLSNYSSSATGLAIGLARG